jgi:hypothetical protein
MTESEEAFARRAVRRKGLFLKLSVASLIVAAGLVAAECIRSLAGEDGKPYVDPIACDCPFPVAYIVFGEMPSN